MKQVDRDMIADIIAKTYAREVQPLRADIAELKTRVAALSEPVAGPPGPPGEPGRDGVDGKDGLSEIAALRSAIETLQAGKADNDLSDREFERRVEASLAESPVDVVRDAVVGAMREVPRPTINVSVPITMPRRGKEVMTVEHDARGRIARSIKEEVD